MKQGSLALIVGALLLVAATTGPVTTAPRLTSGDLRAPEAFASVADPTQRSLALYAEASRVIMHPRCVNCHPIGRTPHQRDEARLHVPLVSGGSDGHGMAGLPCAACHFASNSPTLAGRTASVPGAPHWALAPAVMTWEGKTAGQICRQMTDPRRNGGRSLAALHEHMADDALVGWAWHPGPGRTPAPGTQKIFGALVAAWIATGAACPAG